MVEFKKMMRKIFKDDGEGDVLAVLKRSIVFVALSSSLGKVLVSTTAVREPGNNNLQNHHRGRSSGPA